MRLIFLSRSLTHEAVRTNTISTSSQKFEIELIKEMRQIADVALINYGGTEGRTSDVVLENVLFSSTGFSALLHEIRRVAGGSKAAVIATGYDPRLITVLLACRAQGHASYTFIYDTHRIAIREKRVLRRNLIDLYFRFGFEIAKRVDGWIVLNDRFIKKRNLRVKYLKTRVGAGDEGSSRMPRTSTTKHLLFAGTLNDDNGVSLLLSAFRSIPARDIELHVYGDGPLAGLVRDAASRDERIRAFGRVANDIVVSRQKEADCLIHLRDPNSVATDYSYPSKLIEYLCSDSPVISNLFPGIGDDVSAMVVPVDGFCEEAIRNAILDFVERPRQGHSEQPSRYLRKSRGWDLVAGEVKSFVSGDRCIKRAGSV